MTGQGHNVQGGFWRRGGARLEEHKNITRLVNPSQEKFLAVT